MEVDVKKTQPDFKLEGEESSRKCPACGASAREQARFCATCGRALEGSYFPSDALRSSYHQQEIYEKKLRKMSHNRRDRNEKEQKDGRVISNLFAAERNGVAKMALAFATYSLVPYLGILFCPCAVFFGGVGLIRSYRFARYDGRRTALASILLGILILCVQLVLWWLLYKIPELSRQF